MTQLHFTVDEQTAKRIKSEAKKRGMTVSRYLAGIMTRDAGGAWPAGYLDGVVGSCAAVPLSEPTDLELDDIDLGRG